MATVMTVGPRHVSSYCPSSISVLLVSCDRALHNRLLSAFTPLGVIPAAACEICLPEKAVETLLAVDPAVAVIDAPKRPTQTRELVATIRRAARMTPLLVLSDSGSASDALEALKLGAQGQCARRDASVIARAVVAIQNGDAWFPRRVMLQVIQELNGAQSLVALPHRRFVTSREREICRMVGEGRCNKEIATALGISHKTVKNHLTAVFEKLGVTSRLELAVSLAKR